MMSSQPLHPQAESGSSVEAGSPGRAATVVGYGRSVQFSGYTWLLKVSSIPTGPGPNYFSDGPDSVWVDERGHLHLRLAPRADGLWYAAEVVCTAMLGYG